MIPEKNIIDSWQLVLEQWITDESIPLFVRKSGKIRGSKITDIKNRVILITDNTPAHWVFKNAALVSNQYSKTEIETLLKEQRFPISFIRKISEYTTLTKEMVADKETRLSIDKWKLAHIDGIAMKRGKNITLEDYKNHHRSFLSLSNVYLIDKDFSGLAEVELFNEIVKNYKGEIV